MTKTEPKPDEDGTNYNPHPDVVEALKERYESGPAFERSMERLETWFKSKTTDELRLDACCYYVNEADERDPRVDRSIEQNELGVERNGRRGKRNSWAIVAISTLLLVACGAGAFVVAGGGDDGIVLTEAEIIFTEDATAAISPIDRPNHPGLLIDSQDFTLVSLGKADGQLMTMSATFELKKYGQAGLFFGFSEETTRGLPTIIQVFEIGPVDKTSMRGCRLRWQQLKIHWKISGGPTIGYTTLAKTVIPDVDMNEPHLLSVTTTEGNATVTFDGKPIDVLTLPKGTANTNVVSFRGRFGVFSYTMAEVLRPLITKE